MPPHCPEGPAFCPACNAAMIELEQLAIGLAVARETVLQEYDETFDARWLHSKYPRALWRRRAARKLEQEAPDQAREARRAKRRAYDATPQARERRRVRRRMLWQSRQNKMKLEKAA